MGTSKPQSNAPLYSNTVIDTLAIVGCAVTFGTAKRGLGGLQPRPGPSLLYNNKKCKCNSSLVNSQCMIFILFNVALILPLHSKGLRAQQTLAATFIASQVDYCSGVLYSVSSQVIRRLEMVLSTAAHLVVGVGRYVTLCNMLLWLTVPLQMQF